MPQTARATSGEVLRDARRRAGLTQSELARRAGLTQSVISAYESGARQPSVPTLQRLVGATGLELAVTIRRPALRTRLTGPLGKRLIQQRSQIRQIAAGHGASNIRVFGSVARGSETPRSDIDILVDLDPGTGLLGLARLQHELSALLGARVDVVPASDLKAGVAPDVLIDAIAL